MDRSAFDAPIEHFQEELTNIRTNRANPTMVEKISVHAYDSQMSLLELASISVPEPQTLVIQPWDQSVIKNIEKALRDSDAQLSPVVDGTIIRLNFPPLTEEQRKQFVKQMHEKAEHARISIRKVREQILKEYKEQKTNGDLSEDEFFRQEKEVQQLVDEYNKKIDEMAQKKEEELMSISS